MFVSPLVAALLIGSFWTGIGTAAVVSNSDVWDHHRSDVVISAQATDHDTACAAKYRSYNPDTGMYLSSRDYKWHDCRL
ncbi:MULTISPECIES: BA14K family protein [unclassified Devosia]|uniref:BA14K family protein n=1 Tax=unclassified Devosia TaxID=196773 RepID=UPI001AC7FD80|nr:MULTISPECIES: BA14K family protein [unclassified Devosia]MBN9306406.1 BA14K family protein [Devosia sp.]